MKRKLKVSVTEINKAREHLGYETYDVPADSLKPAKEKLPFSQVVKNVLAVIVKIYLISE